MNHDRRRVLLGLAALTIASPIHSAERLSSTPRQTAGPFYPTEIPLDDDNDLTRVTGQVGSAQGEIADLTGRIRGSDGRPLRNLRIEIWQCDANGRYRHPYEQGTAAPDPGFQGHGATETDAVGRYRFRTIRPVPYPGRTPHIHVAVFPAGDRPFTTQLYAAGEARNQQDFLYQRIPSDKRHLVTVDFQTDLSSKQPLHAKFDIVLGDGTPRG